MTGVIVRSAVNVSAGAKTRASTVMHGLWIALFLGTMPFLLTRIPLAVLASVLVLTGFKLLNIPHLLETFKKSKLEGGIWVFTATAIFATDLLKGLAIALAAVAVIRIREIAQMVRVAWARQMS